VIRLARRRNREFLSRTTYARFKGISSDQVEI
jgi:hypothetical protein